MKVIQVRGTSGSGKSTVVRRFFEELPGGWDKHWVEGRKRPMYYTARKNPGIILLGHYEIACGGCDTIGSVPAIFAAMVKLPPYDVLISEGLLLSEDVKWTLTLPDVCCLFLTTHVDECLRRVVLRQKVNNRVPPDPERVVRKLTRRVETIERARKRLVAAGVSCRRYSSSQCLYELSNLVNAYLVRSNNGCPAIENATPIG